MVVAAGAWTGRLMLKAAPECSESWLTKIQPRKGHLLEIHSGTERHVPSLRHGLMEIGYAKVGYLWHARFEDA